MVETFLSVLKSKKLISQKIKKLYEFYLLWKTNRGKVIYIRSSSLVMGPKRHAFLREQNIRYSPYLKNSFYTDFLKDVDSGKNIKETKYYQLMIIYANKSFAFLRTKTFKNMYIEFKKSDQTKHICVYKDINEWNGYYPDYPLNVQIKSPKNSYMIFDGHHRGAIMIHLGMKSIPVKFIEKDFLFKIVKKL